jgi:hypothetical protein
MDVAEAEPVAAVVRAVYVDQDPAGAVQAARDPAVRTGKVLLPAALPHVQLDQMATAAVSSSATPDSIGHSN